MDTSRNDDASTPVDCDGIEWSVTLNGDVERVGPVISEIMDRVRNTKVIHDHEFEVEVALLEAVANAVKHGCGGDPEKHVTVQVVCDADVGMRVTVRDPGPGFDPDEVPSPLEEENLLGTSGRGVFLIRRLMDEVRYEDNGATLIMTKRPA
jgi:serine/threonine-protein kinase RsbW